MARAVRSVSIPKELAGRMQEFDLNWSRIAADAFEKEVRAMENAKSTRLEPEVVERLRASKERVESAEHRKGYEVGQRWAKHQAEYDELRRAAELDGEVSFDTLVEAIRGEDYYPNTDLKDFAEEWGVVDDGGLFSTGFVAAAAEVLEQVDAATR